MITVNDKLKLFQKRIVEKRQKAYDDKVHILEDNMEKEFQERKVLLEQDRRRYEDSLLKGIKSERSQRLSNARSEKKRRLLQKRKNMIETLLEGVKGYTDEFVHTEAYNGYLMDLLEKHQTPIQHLGNFDVYMNKEDYKSKQSMLQKVFGELGLSCKAFHVYEKPIIGGMILLNEDGSTRLDLSLDSVIEDNRTYMGQLIYDILEKAGEVSG